MIRIQDVLNLGRLSHHIQLRYNTHPPVLPVHPPIYHRPVRFYIHSDYSLLRRLWEMVRGWYYRLRG